ncbi:MAG TPA: hypothetical protein VFA12_05400 [Stellaceae bacterium]|nr:hypothetical protein [Stellaceae bacterium]
MADDVQIRFGADIDEALAAIARLKEAIAALAEPVSRNKAQFSAAGADFAHVQRDMAAAQVQAAAELEAIAAAGVAARQRLDQSYIESFKRAMQVLVDEKKITSQQALGFDIEYSAGIEAQERERLETLLAGDSAAAADKLKTYQELMQLDARYAAQLAEDQKKIADDARAQADKIQRSYEQSFDQVGRSAQRTFNQILTGQTTWRQGAVRLVQDFETFFLEQIETIAAKWAASGLASLAGGAVATAVSGAQATGGSGLGAGLMALAGIGQPAGLFGTGLLSAPGAAAAAQTTAVTANTTAVTALTAAVSGLTAAVGAGAATAGGGAIAGGAVGAGGLVDLLAFAGGGIVPSAAGGWALPSFAGTTPALLHGREMVLPADISQGLQEMIGGGRAGAGDTHVHIHAIDSRSGAQFVMTQAHNIARALQRAQRGFNPATMAR